MLCFGEITVKVAEKVLKQLEDGTLDRIVINTEGGDFLAALAIYDAIVGKGITVVGTGQVASAGVFILLGGDKRYCTKHTRFMTHPISVEKESGEEVTPEEFLELQTLQTQAANLFAERAGMTTEEALRMLSKEYNFGLPEAAAMGFVEGEWNDRAGL